MLTARAAFALLIGEGEVGKRAFCYPNVVPARDRGLHKLPTDRLAALTQTIAYQRTFIINKCCLV